MRIPLLITGIFLIIFSFSYPTNAEEKEKFAIILAYFQVGNDLDPEFSISQNLFDQHIKHLEEGAYNIISLRDFMRGEFSSDNSSKKNVVLTFENVAEDTLDIIAPVLDKKGIPYTLFITPDNFVSEKARKKLSKALENKLVTVGFHTDEYKYYDSAEVFETSLNSAKSLMREALGGVSPEFCAYPYSLYKQSHIDIVQKHDFTAVLGQHSGAALPEGNDVLPRFTMTENYASLERFQRILSVSPLLTSDEEPKETVIDKGPVIVGFTLEETADPHALSCFLSGKGRIAYEVVSGKRIEIRPSIDPEHVRYRLNCILHDGDEGEILKWRGFLFEVLGVRDEAIQ